MLINKSYPIPVDSEIKILKVINNLEVFNLETKAWKTLNINTNFDSVIFTLELEKGSGKLFRME